MKVTALSAATAAFYGFEKKMGCRTIGWLRRNRRMIKDYEFLTETSESLIYAAMSRLMLKRLTIKVSKSKNHDFSDTL